MLKKFTTYIAQHHLFTKDDKLLIAVSGGVDSVVLCELCKQAGFNFSIAHCNFQLRGAESERDEKFVKELAAKYGVDVFIKRFYTGEYSVENKISIQEAARQLRYTWFRELKDACAIENREKKFPFLLTAHHANDNIETLLMNFFRGTGIAGMTGIPVKTDWIRRPLIDFYKKELVDFAFENKLEFVEDSSNACDKYTRNFLRNELIPKLSNIYPKIQENLSATIKRFNDIEKLWELSVGEMKKKLCKVKGKEIHIPVKQLMMVDNRAFIYEIVKDYGFSEKQIDEVIKLSSSESGSYLDSPGSPYRIIRHRHWFIISPLSTEEAVNIIIEPGQEDINFSLGTLRISKSTQIDPDKIKSNNLTATLDLKNTIYPLLLRKWKTADYFYPLGMKKKKKISRFLIDQKLSKTDKEKVWVIESNKKIIWVVGYRIDERFKLTEKTKEALQLTLTPSKETRVL
jgi:tRNA(Ile)-lysidine synthase